MITHKYRLTLLWKEGRPDIIECKTIQEIRNWANIAKGQCDIHCVDLVTKKVVSL